MLPADHGAEHDDHLQNFVDRALVEDVHVDTAAHQFGGDVGLQVGKTQYQIGFQVDDTIDLGRGKSRYPGFFAARRGRSDGKTGNADDTILLAEQVKHLGRFLGQADDSLWIIIGHA